eukprot:13952793-Alexandrium_andersonii.AAC.1
MSTETASQSGAEWAGHALGLETTEEGPASSRPAGLAISRCRFDALSGGRSPTHPCPLRGVG